MQIRSYEDADERAVVDLWKEVFPYDEPAKVIRQKRAFSSDLFFVAEADGHVVGTAMGGYDGHRGWVYRLAVRPQHRSRGIGAALMSHVERALAKLGCPKINLQAHGDNAQVAAFYEKLGYAIENRVSMGKVISDRSDSSAD